MWRLGRVVWVSDMVSNTFGKGWECWEFPCYSIGRVTGHGQIIVEIVHSSSRYRPVVSLVL